MTPFDPEHPLQKRLRALDITDDDLEEKFIRGSGSGGQKINKTSSCVSLIHLPSGTAVKCQRERSRELNRALAREELCQKLETSAREKKAARRQAREKKRRRNRRPSRRARARNVQKKRRHGQKKKLRRRPGRDD